jgi:hypothetical protein
MRRYGGLYHLHPNPDTEAGNPAAFAHCRGVFLWILDPENRFLGLTCSCFFIEPLDTLPGADPDDAWHFLLSCGGYELILCGAAEGDYLCWGAGLPGLDVVLYYGLLAPSGASPAIVQRLNKELRQIVNSDDVKMRLISDGGGPMPSTPEEYAANIEREEGRWRALVNSSASRSNSSSHIAGAPRAHVGSYHFGICHLFYSWAVTSSEAADAVSQDRTRALQ